MRKFLCGLGFVTAIISLAGALGCRSLSEPTADEAKGVQVLEQPDPRTLLIYGHVTAQNTIAPDDWRQIEELTIERLKAAAKRQFPEATVLFNVVVMPGDGANTFEASGIAARRRGS
ncbi:MAG: hypothetical protein HY812_04950 [Planctomycetes bacterium]|nr:hypothetical protein [Planctomycetota bacterium]